jgi:ferredoxin
MKKITIAPGCIGCGLCESIVPEVFKVNNVSHVIEHVDITQHEEKIQEAVKLCPVQVIMYEKK